MSALDQTSVSGALAQQSSYEAGRFVESVSNSSPALTTLPDVRGGKAGESGPPPSAQAVDDWDDDEASPGRYAVLREFYRQLSLSDADVARIEKDRGIIREMSMRMGLRSNPKTNREILEGLRDKFSVEQLLESGLWIKKKDDPVPSAQFYGYGYNWPETSRE